MMMPIRRLITLMAEEDEDNYDIDDHGKANIERKDGYPDYANADNAEAVDKKYGDIDDADMDRPNSRDVDFPMMILPRPIMPAQIISKLLTLIYLMLMLMPLMKLTIIMLMILLITKMLLEMMQMTVTIAQTQTNLTFMTLMI